MKLNTLLLVFAATLHFGLADAETVIEQVPDTLPGKAFGGLSGFMIGATAGPLGAVVGAGIGALSGAIFQQETGLGGRAYRITRDDARQTVVRSPGRAWSDGDQVAILNGRLVSLDSER